MEQLLTIGEFAELCGLSRSALRFYDQQGLVRPRTVDADSGYRFYATSQLEQALLIRRLRAAEMPVSALREYLTAPPGRRRMLLQEHATSFRQRALAVEEAISRLRGELDVVESGALARTCSVRSTTFATALSQVSFALADPPVRPELGAVWIETRDDSLRLVATDSYRLAVRDLVPEAIGAVGICGVIRAEQGRDLAAVLATGDTLVVTQDEEGVITAAVGGHDVEVGGTDAAFPDYDRILTDIPTGHQVALSRNDVEHALAELSLDAPHLLLRFAPDRLELQTRNKWTSVSGSWPGPLLAMAMDPRFFAEAVRVMVGPDLVIEAVDPLQPVTLRSADTGTFSVLTMPIRPPDQA